MKRLAALILTAGSITANAGDYATCVLDKMPGSVNQAFTGSVHNECISEYPLGIYGIIKGSGRGLFGFKDGNTCIQKKAKDTPHPQAAMMISAACRCLYNEASFEREACAYKPQNFTPIQ